VLALVQRGLETLYRVETELDVDDFVIDEATRDSLGTERAPREQLLVRQAGDGELELALYVCPRALANLAAHDPRAHLDGQNLGDFLLAVEGVSHFVYVAYCARQERGVSALELELQAEVDKWLTCALTSGADWRERLFERFTLDPAMGADERERYRVANENARAYADVLHERFLTRGQVPAMLEEVRRFYRLDMSAKLDRIRRG
jgi:hypothetical protein